MGTEVRTLVQFRVLGPLAASRDGQPVRLGGERQRSLLALLLIHSNQLISTERLIELLFGDEPSGNALNAVHVAVSRLRRALGGGDEGPLLTRPGGYMLAVAPGQLDTSRFEHLLGEGRRLLGAGDPGAAAAHLREALALWRGPPLADLARQDLLQPEIRRLEELRLQAQMERIDADLALGREGDLIAEVQGLIGAEPLQERLRGQLMLALYRAGRRSEALAVYRQASRLLREELGLEPTHALRELERMILDQDASLTLRRTPLDGPAARESIVCPFKGLAFFDTADAEYFCGRERVISDLVARLAESALVGILGPSGIGKSSLLRAGVLPALTAGALPRSAGWRQVLMRPGEHPGQELERAIGPGGLPAALAQLPPTARLVIAVDQLEELFTVCESEQERAAFLEQLAAAAADPERRVLVVCALRADFYGRLGANRRFARLLSNSHALIGPMDRDELAQAIEQPASRAGLVVEHSLVDALVAEVAGEPGGLPLLSTTLLELWQARDGRRLRYESYRTGGGVRGAVGRLAEAAYAQQTEPERRAVQNVMLRLVSGEDGALARRRVPVSELEQLADGAKVLATLVDARLLTVGDGKVELSHEALLREWPRYRSWLDEDRIGRRVHAHLIAAAREWDLRGRDCADLYRGTRLADALAWSRGNRERCNTLEREFLDSARRQAGADAQRQRFAQRRLRSLRVAAAGLLMVAVLAGAFALVKQRTAADANRAAAADARAALGRQLGTEAGGEPRLDLAMLLAREAVSLNLSQQTEGNLLATLLRSPAVIASVPLPSSALGQLALSPDGRTLAVADETAQRLSFYDTATHEARRASLSDFTGDQSPVYSDDGSLLVYPAERDAEPSLAVRDARTLARLDTLAFDPRLAGRLTADIPHSGILISPDRRTVLYAYWLTHAGSRGGAYLDRWSLPSGRRQPTVRIGSGSLLAIRLIEGGRLLLVASAHRVSWLDAHSLRAIRSLAIRPAPAGPSVAAVSPDGATVALGSRSGTVSFLDAGTAAVHPGLGGHRASVVGVFYSHDGESVATVAADNTVIVWNPATGDPIEQLAGPTGQVQSATASPDGATLYTASLDGDLLAWDLTGARQFGFQATLGSGVGCCSPLSPHAPPLAMSPDGSRFAVRLGSSTAGLFWTRTLQRQASFRIRPGDDGITALAWSPSAPLLAVAGHSGFVQLWSVAGSPRLEHSLFGLHALVGRPEAIQTLAFSHDGSLIAAADENQTRSAPEIPSLPASFLAVWQAGTGALIGAPREIEVGSSSRGSDALAFAPGQSLLAASLPDGRVLVLEAMSGQVRQTLSPAGGSTSLAFAPDGTLATGTAAGTVQLWNPVTGRRVAPALIAASAPITSIAFEPGGRRFATTGYRDGAVKLWFTSTLQQEGPALEIDPEATPTAAFAPGARDLLVIEDRGSARLWPVSLATWAHRACAIAGRNLSRQEWARFVAQPRYTAVCPQDSAPAAATAARYGPARLPQP